MSKVLSALIVLTTAFEALAGVQELAHYSLQGLPGAAAPQVLRDRTGRSPDLERHGSPTVVADVPESRQKDYRSSLRFDDPDQCYRVATNLVQGDNFVLEVWVKPAQMKDEGWHSVVANGNGGRGFLVAQHDDGWEVMVGGVGAVRLGDVDPGQWTHLAIVGSQGALTGWVNGQRAAGVPRLNGAIENFSIGATAPGREAFQGLIAEVRYATFQPGQFDPTRDFLGNPKPPRRASPPAGPEPVAASHTLQNRYAAFGFDDKGHLISITSRQTGKQYCPGKYPSPVMCLHENGQPNDQLLAPVSAHFDAQRHVIELKYAGGATAVVKAEAKETYLRFQLESLAPRGNVDNIVWGPINTKIFGRIGDLIGVVREDDWAIGLYGLDDNTIAGPVTDGDCYSMGYYIHSTDPEVRVPRKYKEGEWINIDGDGRSDVAYFSHPEEYFQYVCGNGAKLEPDFGSSIAYHSRDRRRSYVNYFSLLPGFQEYRRRHAVSDPIPGVDFMGTAVALYACPDDDGLATLEKITLAEDLPYITDLDGKWIRDPSSFTPTLNWNGPYDKAIEYTKALGFKALSRETGEFYPSRGNNWTGGGVRFSDGRTMTGGEFLQKANEAGLAFGGMHTLTMFLQGGRCVDVTPVPSEHLQTVCRTHLARDISATDTELEVTDPSFLAERGTWHAGNGSNYLRIGGEMLRYEGISEQAPWILQGVKRGHASKAAPHKAGDELVKLMQNCYHGFAPDMPLLLEYADYYADLMHRNGLQVIGFDGFESTVYQGHGYYAVRAFCRRLFETYGKLTGGKTPYITVPSNIFAGSWEYMASCNVGGGSHMFSPITGRRGIEGKDLGTGWSNSYYPGTFGIQGWDSAWSLYDAENLQAKAVGWDATYALSASEDAIDRTGERDAILKAFRAWQNARALLVFSKEQKRKLQNPDFKFHLEQTGPKRFTLYPVQEFRFSGDAKIANPHQAQPLQFSLHVAAPADGFIITLPDGQQLKSSEKLAANQYIICKGDRAYVADSYRKRVADLTLGQPAVLPQGESTIAAQLTGSPRHRLTVWVAAPEESIQK